MTVPGPDESVASENVAREDGEASRGCVLVVDDRPDSRRQIRARLQARGFSVLEAGDGRDAWEGFQEGRFIAVVTDIQMPRSDGVELLERVRSASSVPVFCITAYPDLDTGLLALKRGAEYYYRWPLELDRLVDDLDRRVGRSIDLEARARQAQASLDAIRRSGRQRQAEARRRLVSDALRQTGGNVGQAAELLRVSRRTMYHWMKRYGVDRPGDPHG